MRVTIRGMQLPDKCCKCQILSKSTGVCPLLKRRMVDLGKRHPDCPMEVADDGQG